MVEKQTKFDLDKNNWIVLIIVCIVPFLTDFITFYLSSILYMTGAHITSSGIIFYIVCLVAGTALLFSKFRIKTSNVKKRILVAGSFLFMLLWLVLFYIPLYDVVTDIVLQLILTSLSILSFSLGMNGILQLFSRLNMVQT